MNNILSNPNQLGGAMTEGDDSGFCKSITSMTSSASSLVLLKPPQMALQKGTYYLIITENIFSFKINSNLLNCLEILENIFY